jgi:hypothetical protein
MKPNAFRIVCRLLVVSILVLPLRPATAGMIATDQALAAAAAQADREALGRTLSRSDVIRELLSQGVDPEAVKARVASLTDAEVHALAGRIGTAPAGGDATGWAILVFTALLIWVVYAYR